MKYYLFFLTIILLFFRYIFSLPTYKEGDIIKIKSQVLSEPIYYDNTQYIKLKNLKIYLPKHPQVTYGDYLEVVGKVEDGKLKNSELLSLSREKGGIFSLRNKLVLFYKKNLPEPHGSLVAGTVLGSKQMPETFWEKLKETGTAHVVVASGTNVALVAGFLISMTTLFWKRRTAIVVSLLGVFVYVFLSGFDAPIVRAAIMGSVALFAQRAGRLVSASRALFFSIVVMLFIYPQWVTDLGFILSVLATAGLLLFQKKVDKKISFIPSFFREGLSTTIAAQIFVLPVIYVSFGQFNIFSPLINALIIWTIPYIMVLGGVSAILGLIFPFLGRMILYLTYPLTWFFVNTLSIF